MDNPLLAALEESTNTYLSFSQKDLIKLCKKQDIPAEYSDNSEDLAFLLFRLEQALKMSAIKLKESLEALGLTSKSKKKDAMKLITFELCLVDLLTTEEDELIELCKEYKIERGGSDNDQALVQIAVKMCS